MWRDEQVKLQGEITINGKGYRAGEIVPWKMIYPFFMVHMLVFGGTGFFMAYGMDDIDVAFLYMHGGIAIVVYMVFYTVFFGRDAVQWMLINAALGVFGIYAELNWALSFFGKSLDSYPIHVHVVPFLYYVLYTFLLRQAVLHLAGARENESRRRWINGAYVLISVAVYASIYKFA